MNNMENLSPEDDFARRILRSFLLDVLNEIEDKKTFDMSLNLLYHPATTVEQLLYFLKNDIGATRLRTYGIRISDWWLNDRPPFYCQISIQNSIFN